MKIDIYELPDNLYYYAESYLWVRKDSDTEATVGLTDFAQQQAGKVSTIRLRAKGFQIDVGKVFGTMETFKWVGALKAPLKGVIDAINEEVIKNPKLVKESPYDKGWLIKTNASNLSEDLSKLLTNAAVVKWMEEEIKKAKERSIT